MKELVFLLEESSAKAMLDELLPRVLNSAIRFRCVPFQGKQDLEKQLARKIRDYQNAQARFIVLRDLDSHPDCVAVKARLLDACRQSGKQSQCLVRIACCELESFYLADLKAVGAALEIDGLERHQPSRKCRHPDGLGNPARELASLTQHRYQKVAGSRAIGAHLNPENTRSASFRNLMAAVRRFEAELLQATP